MTKLCEPFLPSIPFKGNLLPARVLFTPFSSSRIYFRENQLQVSVSSLTAQTDDLTHQIEDQIYGWLKAQARRAFCEEVERQKLQHGFAYKAVSLKDTRSRWGSCSSKGNLNFNWRLIMAPSEILAYVVTHETAHLEHLNHSSDFWKLVGERCNYYVQAKGWLQNNGTSLMNWGLKLPDC